MNIIKGTVYLAGAGPGDPGLLTRRVFELLRHADCLVYDALVSDEIMALASTTAERIYVGKRGNQHAYEQHEINQLLVDKAKENKSILRLKGGDPYLFGRGAEEAIHLLEQGVAVDVIPGVTAGIAAPAYAGIPVTHRDHASAVTFVTGHEDPNKPESAINWEALSKVGTLCFYMGIKNLGRITSQLARHLPPTTPVAVVQWGTTPRQRTATGTLTTIVEEVQRLGIQAPALTIVGEVVRYRQQLNFFEQRPLFGRKIMVTRARAQASVLADGLRELGATVYEFPTIRIDFTPTADLTSSVTELTKGNYDWLILTSVNGVDAVFEELYRQKSDARGIRAKIAAIGSATEAHLRHRGVVPDLVPPEYVAESIVETLKTQGAISGQRFLLTRADIARSELPRALKELGAEVRDVVAYHTRLETDGQEAALQALEANQVDAVTFTSASTARNFADVLGPQRFAAVQASQHLKCFSIGPQTTRSMQEVGLPIHAEAQPHDIPGLIKAIEKHCLKRD